MNLLKAVSLTSYYHRQLKALLFIGTVVGFAFTSVVLNLLNSGEEDNDNVHAHLTNVKRTPMLPDSPHSHGEMDSNDEHLNEQSWHDHLSDSHVHENTTVADRLYNTTRILCWVMTSPKNAQSKAKHVRATWGRRCNILKFVSSQANPELDTIALKVHEGHDYLWGKTRLAFKYIYENHFDDADWFLKADDDTYIVVENLRLMLEKRSPREPVFFGRRFLPHVRQGYMSGGAGYVLSKEAVYRFVLKALPDASKCQKEERGVEDVELGRCLENVGVRAGDSRDEMGRDRFYPFYPELHMIPGIVPKDNWYWSYNYHPLKEGLSGLSPTAISFHYVPPKMMYTLEYLIYHLKPYGTTTRIIIPTIDSTKTIVDSTTVEDESILELTKSANVQTIK